MSGENLGFKYISQRTDNPFLKRYIVHDPYPQFSPHLAGCAKAATAIRLSEEYEPAYELPTVDVKRS